MNFKGKICPYCKTEFKEDDDVVICSNCEMPHHKECWTENKACTTFGCTGTIMGTNNFIGDNNLIVNNNLVGANNFMNTNNDNSSFFCTKCGAAYIDGKVACDSCGNILLDGYERQNNNGYSQTNNEKCSYFCTKCGTAYIDGKLICDSCGNSLLYEGNNNYNSYNRAFMDADMETFVGENQNYFSEKFQKSDFNNSKISWNWASAFFGVYWFAYRKMYKIAFLYYVIVAITQLVPVLSYPYRILLFMLSGIFGNYVYKCQAEEHVQIAKNMDDNMKRIYLRKKGGTSSGVVWTTIALVIFIGTFLRIIKRLYL